MRLVAAALAASCAAVAARTHGDAHVPVAAHVAHQASDHTVVQVWHPEAAQCRADDGECVLAASRQPAWVDKYSVAAAGPEQLWINYGATPDAVAVRWCTNDSAALTQAAWGLSPTQLVNTVTGVRDRYTWGVYTSPWIHNVNFTGLPLNTTIYYQVGDAASGQSSVYAFPSNPGVGATPAHYPYTVAFVADVGESDAAAKTINNVLAAAASINSVVINGDISYASGCEEKGCTVWDAWGRLTQPLAAIRPWAVTLGNHEEIDYFNGIVAASATYR